jgi:hypothetical protein
LLVDVVTLAGCAVPSRSHLAAENLFLRKQLAAQMLSYMNLRITAVASLYADVLDHRPSIPPEQLLQYLYTVRSERLQMEEIDYSVLDRSSTNDLINCTFPGGGIQTER